MSIPGLDAQTCTVPLCVSLCGHMGGGGGGGAFARTWTNAWGTT